MICGEEGLVSEVWVDEMRLEDMCQYLIISDMLWTNQVQMDESEVASGGGLQVLLALWLMLGFCSFIVLVFCMSHYSCLFLRMVVRQ